MQSSGLIDCLTASPLDLQPCIGRQNGKHETPQLASYRAQHDKRGWGTGKTYVTRAIEAKPFSNNAGRHLGVDVLYPTHGAGKVRGRVEPK